MLSTTDRDYYRARVLTEAELAAQSTDANVAAVHSTLAQLYSELLSSAGEVMHEAPLQRTASG